MALREAGEEGFVDGGRGVWGGEGGVDVEG